MDEVFYIRRISHLDFIEVNYHYFKLILRTYFNIKKFKNLKIFKIKYLKYLDKYLSILALFLFYL